MNKKQVIGVYPLSNTASFNIYEVDPNSEYVIAGINDEEPARYEIKYKEYVEDETLCMTFVIQYGDMEIPMNDIMRVE